MGSGHSDAVPSRTTAMAPTTRLLPAVLGLAAAAAAQITPGNLVVLRIGTGASALTNAGTQVFLDEYTAAGAFVQTVPMPTLLNGAQQPFVCSGTATSEGGLTQSVDGRYLVAMGYGAAPGTASIAGTASASVPRVCARVALDETIDTTTALADAYSGNNARGACSWFGGEFWTAGNATTGNGPSARHVPVIGSATSVQLSIATTNVRRVDIFAGQLYCTSAAGGLFGVGTVGVGTPTTGGQSVSPLPGMPLATGPSPYDFFFADATTVYVADDRTTSGGGIQKWTATGGVWNLQYVFTPGVGVGCRGLSGYVANGVATLFATTTTNGIVKVVDTGAAATVTPLAIGAANTALRGIRWIRTPASVVNSGAGCGTTVGTPLLTTNGAPLAGNAGFELSAYNTPPNALALFSVKLGDVLPVGLPVPGTPPCVQAYVLPDALAAVLADPFGAAVQPLPIPAGVALGGTRVAVQAFVLDFGLTGFALPLGQSDAMQIVVGN